SLGSLSPDGAVVSVALGGKKGAPLEVWFFDARTLQARGKLTGKGDPERYGWGGGLFTPDGKRFVAFDSVGNVLVWDVAAQKLERTLPVAGDRQVYQFAFSPDGKTLAAGWWPKFDADLADDLDPDPRDLPQPRVSLIALDGSSPPRILMAPHGAVGS